MTYLDLNYTMEAFLEKAREVHGDRYNYEKVVYVNAKTKVTIICSLHGDFLIRPACHTNQEQGCALCARNSRVDTKECLSRLNAIFGDRYGYDEVALPSAYEHTQCDECMPVSSCRTFARILILLQMASSVSWVPPSCLRAATMASLGAVDSTSRSYVAICLREADAASKLHRRRSNHFLRNFSNLATRRQPLLLQV